MMVSQLANPPSARGPGGFGEGMTMTGSYQRMSGHLHRAIALAALIGAAADAAGEESRYDRARREHPVLFKLYYDETVMAYCGLLTPESEAGFRLERGDLLATDPLSAEVLREVRVASDMAADYAYQDHGLSGQKRWCRTEGLEAYNRFLDRYRAQAQGPAGRTE